MSSLPPVSAKVLADAEQFIAEFKRADSSSRESMHSIEDQVEHMAGHIEKRFQSFKLFEGLMAGAIGISSGSMLVEHTIEKWKALFEDGEKAAEEFKKSMEELNKQFHQLAVQQNEFGIKGRSPAEQLTARQEELVKNLKEIQEINEKIAKAGNDIHQLTTGEGETNLPKKYGYFTYTKTMGDEAGKVSDEEAAKWRAAMSERIKILEEIRKLTDEINKKQEEHDKRESGIEGVNKGVEEMLKKNEEAARKAGEQQEKYNLKLDDQAKKLQEMIDPNLKYIEQMDEACTLWETGRISAIELAQALGAINDEMNKPAIELNNKNMEAAIKMMNDQMEDAEKAHEKAAVAATRFGEAIGSSFERAAQSGNGLKGMLKSLAQDLENYLMKKLVFDQMGAAIGTLGKSMGGSGIIGSIASLFFADGGDPPVGVPYMVGEKGPELRVDKTAGTIIPNSKLGSLGGGGGNTYYVDARGADQGAVQRISQALMALAGPGVVERRAASAAYDSRRRGGS